MAYACKILADSRSDYGIRLTTFEVTFPRFILAEVNTHRMLSRNSASSRAIPVAKSIVAVANDPFIPSAFGQNQKGMQADYQFEGSAHDTCRNVWLDAIDDASYAADQFERLSVHKGLANRVLEPYKWHTAIITATDWSNFFTLRTHKDTQPEFREIAMMMLEAYESNDPWHCPADCWHIPLIEIDELGEEPDYDWWTKVSVGRCARVSYLTHDGRRDPCADIGLYNQLRTSGHLSPFEHVARPFSPSDWSLTRTVRDVLTGNTSPFANHIRDHVEYCGNLRGWRSHRYDIPNQDDFGRTFVPS
jgi:thymidylate synthase ThyX